MLSLRAIYGQFLKRWEYQTTLPISQETCMQDKKQQLEPDMQQLTGSKWERSTTNLRYADDTTLMAETDKELKRLLMRVKEESEKAALKLNSGHRNGKGQFSFQSQRKQCPRMFKLPYNCTHLTS